jgi:hypothetical protein
MLSRCKSYPNVYYSLLADTPAFDFFQKIDPAVGPICPNLNRNAPLNDISGTVSLVYSHPTCGATKKLPEDPGATSGASRTLLKRNG